MKSHRLLRVALVALMCSPVAPLAARAADSDNVQALRDRIRAEISAGLPRPDSTPAPRPLTSRPAAIHAASAASAPAIALAAATTSTPADSTPDGVWNALLAGNQRFVAEQPRVRPYARERNEVAGEQQPRAIVLGCSDSRVSPELVFDQSLGDVFVVRTAGNIVDPIALGSLEYAVEHLHACLLVVLGHTSCGAVRAAAAGGEMPSSCLQAIVDRIRPTVQRLSNCFEGDELVERSVVENARQSATDVVANSALLRQAVARGELKIVSAVYDLHTGVVTSVSAPAATAAAQAPGH